MRLCRFRVFLSTVLALLLLSVCSTAPAARKLTGKVETLKGVRVLSLTGSPRENGYTQGFLLADELMTLTDNALAMADRFSAGVNYNVISVVVSTMVTTSDAERAEAEGMIEGMRDKLGPRGIVSKVLDRELTGADILNINALPDLGGIGCSSFAAWGSRTADGQMIVGRNLDYFGRDVFSSSQVLIVRKSPDKRRKSLISPGVIGMIGTGTSINQDGLMQASHDSGGLIAVPVPPARLRSNIARECMETISPKRNVVENAAAFCRRHHTTFATNFLIAGPTAPAGILEYDQRLQLQSGVTVRFPPTDGEWIVTTNHFRKRGRPRQCTRYVALADRLKAGTKLTSLEDAWKLIGRASVEGTLHTMVYKPSERRLLLSFSTAATPAHQRKPARFTLDELFDNARK